MSGTSVGSHLRTVDAETLLVLVNTEARVNVEFCRPYAACAFTLADEYLPSCGRCGEALRPRQDLAEIVTKAGERISCHAEPCCAEVVAAGGHLA